MSIRNAQRVMDVLESIGAVKTVAYGRQKIIVSLNRYFEREVLESVKALIPLAVDALKIPLSEVGKHYREIALALARLLGIKSRPKNSVFVMVKNVLRNDLERRPLPHWMRRILSEEEMNMVRIVSDTAKQPQPLSDNPSLDASPG